MYNKPNNYLMKKLTIIMAALIISLTACADHQHLVEYAALPVQAQKFIQQYFNTADIAYIECERDGMHKEYDVYLKNATEIDFDHQGNLKTIDCQRSPIPDGIVPEAIMAYIRLHYPEQFAVKYSIDYRHQEVELNTDIELEFDLEGNFIRWDD